MINLKINVAWIIVFISIIAAVIYLWVISVYDISENRHYDISVTEINDCWKDSKGTTYSLSDLPKGENIITADVSDIKLDNMRFLQKALIPILMFLLTANAFIHITMFSLPLPAAHT